MPPPASTATPCRASCDEPATHRPGGREVKPVFEFDVNRLLAVAERDLRRFRRNRAFIVPMVLMPIVYLVILGKAMGGDLHDLPIALVDQDHGPAAVDVHDRLVTLQQSRELFRLTTAPEPNAAV